nr:DUF3093 domain-containing protein [Tomitella biformata]
MSNASRSPAAPNPAATTVAYTERLWIPIWWWVAALAVGALIGYEIGLAVRGVPAWVFIVAMVPVAAAACLWLCREQISVSHEPTADADPRSPLGTLDIKGRAHLPLSAISRTVSVPASARSAAMGRQLDPEAFVAQRTWIKTMVLIVLDDPTDPTPYWLVSSRNPDKLMAALGSARIESAR